MSPAAIMDLVGAFAGFLLTVMVASYIFGDNILFRIAVHLFVGVSAGFATVVILYNVLWYQLFLPLFQAPLENGVLVFPPILFGVWMLTKASPRLARWGNPVLAFLVGVGAATAVGGAVLGTIFPQMGATINAFDLVAARQSGQNLAKWFFDALLVLVGTVTTLTYFHFGVRTQADQPVRRQVWVDILSKVGQIFIAITFGALFAGVYVAALAALIERVSSLWNFIWNLIDLIF